MSNRPKSKQTRATTRPGSSQAGTTGPDRRMWWWIGGGVVAVVLIALVVALVAGNSSDDGATDSTGEVAFAEILDPPLPRFDATAGDPAVGMEAPRIRASEFDGTEVIVDFSSGDSTIIGFFAHWCPHCQRELPRLTEWLSTNDLPDGVQMFAVNTAVDEGAPNYPPSAWYEDVGWPLPVLRDSANSDIAAGYGLSGYPYLVVVDGAGNVFGRISGELTTEQWETLLDEAAAVAL